MLSRLVAVPLRLVTCDLVRFARDLRLVAIDVLIAGGLATVQSLLTILGSFIAVQTRLPSMHLDLVAMDLRLLAMDLVLFSIAVPAIVARRFAAGSFSSLVTVVVRELALQSPELALELGLFFVLVLRPFAWGN